jgi:hypothetical protein
MDELECPERTAPMTPAANARVSEIIEFLDRWTELEIASKSPLASEAEEVEEDWGE